MESVAIKVEPMDFCLTGQAQEACSQGDEALYRGKWKEAEVKYKEATTLFSSAMVAADQPTQMMLQRQIDRCNDKIRQIQEYLDSSTSIHLGDEVGNWEGSELSPLTEYQSINQDSLGPLPFGLLPTPGGKSTVAFLTSAEEMVESYPAPTVSDVEAVWSLAALLTLAVSVEGSRKIDFVHPNF